MFSIFVLLSVRHSWENVTDHVKVTETLGKSDRNTRVKVTDVWVKVTDSWVKVIDTPGYRQQRGLSKGRYWICRLLNLTVAASRLRNKCSLFKLSRLRTL